MDPLLKHKIESSRAQGKKAISSPSTYLWSLHPAFQTVLWFLALCWGSSASLFTQDIMAFSFSGDFWSRSLNWPSVIFFSAPFFLALLFALNSWVARAQNSVVIESMLTMPPHDFWLYYGDKYVTANLLNENSVFELLNSVGKGNESEALDKYEEDIRRVLDFIITLVKKWDSANLLNSGIVYRANIMEVDYFDDIDPVKMNRLSLISKRFSIQPLDLHYTGVVSLCSTKYTTTTQTMTPAPDRERRPVAFPFTCKNSELEQAVNANLRGAPKAAATGMPSYVSDVTKITAEYKNQANIWDQKIECELNKYYTDNPVASSILSIPMKSTSSDRVSWVLNIYRNQNKLLFGGDKVKDFSEIVKPYSILLVNMMSAVDLFEQQMKKLREQEKEQEVQAQAESDAVHVVRVTDVIQGTSASTEGTSASTEGTSASTEDTSASTEDTSASTEDTSASTEDTRTSTEDTRTSIEGT